VSPVWGRGICPQSGAMQQSHHHLRNGAAVPRRVLRVDGSDDQLRAGLRDDPHHGGGARPVRRLLQGRGTRSGLCGAGVHWLRDPVVTTEYRKKSLTLTGAVAMGTGVMIGAGVFALTGQIAATSLLRRAQPSSPRMGRRSNSDLPDGLG